MTSKERQKYLMMLFRNILNIFLINGFLSCICQAQESSYCTNDDDLVITLVNPPGKIQGSEFTSTSNQPFYAYQGIPYAAPPTGTNRFEAPKNPEGWNGIRDATQAPKSCVQFDMVLFKSRGLTAEDESEDCLFVNVYTPIKQYTDNVALPVLVWIHGGAFVGGSGDINAVGPYLFMDQGIVVVTLNYRVGALGFLTTEDGIIPGNVALKDQNFALRWVAQNIHLFGGNASEVTIMGESAGATSVGLHVVGRKDGLFRGAALQSGSSICQWAYTENARNYAFDLGRLVDPSFTSNSSKELLDLLQSVSTNDIVAAARNLPSRENNLGIPGDLIWTAVLEDDNEDAFLTKPMLQSIRTGDYNVVPTLLGYNSEESLTFALIILDQYEAKATAADTATDSIVNIKIRMTDQNRTASAAELKKIYTNKTFGMDLFAFIKLSSDKTFKTAIIKQALASSAFAPAYLYQFSFQSDSTRQILNSVSHIIPGADGVGHGLDMELMWGTPDDIATVLSDPDAARVSQQLVKMWSNFVKYQNPTPERDELLDNIEWPTVKLDNLQYLDIDTKLRVATNPIRYRQIEEIVDAYYLDPAIVY